MKQKKPKKVNRVYIIYIYDGDGVRVGSRLPKSSKESEITKEAQTVCADLLPYYNVSVTEDTRGGSRWVCGFKKSDDLVEKIT